VVQIEVSENSVHRKPLFSITHNPDPMSLCPRRRVLFVRLPVTAILGNWVSASLRSPKFGRTRGASRNLASFKRKRRLAYGVHVVAHYEIFRIDLADAKQLQPVEPLEVGVSRLDARHYAQRHEGR
jgi:hypothetical protein